MAIKGSQTGYQGLQKKCVLHKVRASEAALPLSCVHHPGSKQLQSNKKEIKK